MSIPNVVRRADGSHATSDGAVLYRWAKPAGSVYQEQLRRILTAELGVEWAPDRNGTREMVGFTPAQLRRFSKRTSQIEAYLERSGGVYQTAVERMRADHLASLATRPDKDVPSPRSACGTGGRRRRPGSAWIASLSRRRCWAGLRAGGG